MTLVLVVLGVVILIAIVGRVAWGGRSRGVSVHDYEHAMDTLARMSGRSTNSATGRGWMGQPTDPASPPASGQEASATVLAGLKAAAGKDRPANWLRPASVEPGHSGGGRSMARMGRLAGGVVGLLVLIVLTVTVVSLAVGGSRHTNPQAGQARRVVTGRPGASATSSTGPQTMAPKTAGYPATRPRSTGPRITRSRTTRHSPPTISPSNQVAAVSNDASGATYNAPATGSYMLSFTATGPCWVRVTNAAGTVAFEKTVPSGASGALSLAGPAHVRVGNAADISVQVDGEPVAVPQTGAVPYNLTFQAA